MVTGRKGAAAADLVGLVRGRLHLLVDPALQLVGVPEELLQVEGVLQGGAAGLGALMQRVPAAQQLQTQKKKMDGEWDLQPGWRNGRSLNSRRLCGSPRPPWRSGCSGSAW